MTRDTDWLTGYPEGVTPPRYETWEEVLAASARDADERYDRRIEGDRLQREARNQQYEYRRHQERLRDQEQADKAERSGVFAAAALLVVPGNEYRPGRDYRPHGPEIAYIQPARGHCLPGGKIEPGETPQQAAYRETLEEVGLDVPALLTAPVIWTYSDDGANVAVCPVRLSVAPEPGGKVEFRVWWGRPQDILSCYRSLAYPDWWRRTFQQHAEIEAHLRPFGGGK